MKRKEWKWDAIVTRKVFLVAISVVRREGTKEVDREVDFTCLSTRVVYRLSLLAHNRSGSLYTTHEHEDFHNWCVCVYFERVGVFRGFCGFKPPNAFFAVKNLNTVVKCDKIQCKHHPQNPSPQMFLWLHLWLNAYPEFPFHLVCYHSEIAYEQNKKYSLSFSFAFPWSRVRKDAWKTTGDSRSIYAIMQGSKNVYDSR